MVSVTENDSKFQVYIVVRRLQAEGVTERKMARTLSAERK
jgi:hypothetical protein